MRCFNPRLREGGDVSWLPKSIVDGVSIHASAREATVVLVERLVMIMVSIHASAREATGRLLVLLMQLCFNPRLREGGDLCFVGSLSDTDSFNPRLREGGDVWLVLS